MCGIAGFVHRDPERAADRQRLKNMTRTLVHRGPDGEGFLVQGAAALGMRRLAIIDVAGGEQPLFNEDESIAVIQNGEIYNYLELRQELQARGHAFRTHSDTEVLAHGYEEWGDAVVERLNGMWAFALWDERKRRLLLSRDRLGIKPLHYAWDGSTLVFGSEIKALLEWGIAAELNWEVLDAYVAFGFVPEPYSFYRSVQKLPPGCNLVFELGAKPVERRYWEVPTVSEKDARRDEGRVIEEFGALLQDAVRLQLRSDVPLGAFLSGGLDSSSIVALAADLVPTPLRTFTIGFAASDYDERALARLVAQRYSTQHVERIVEPSAGEAGLELLRRAFDEPFGDASALATHAVAGVAREHVTVTLTGDGGDEVLAGYTRYQGEKFSQTYATLPGFLRRRVLPECMNAARAILPGRLRHGAERAVHVLEAANLDFEDRITRKQAWSSAATRARLLRPPHKQVRPARDFVADVMRACPSSEPFHRLNWFDFKMMLPSQMLTKVDRMSMAHSLEARVPFLDHRLVELMVPVSAAVKLPGYTRKHVLRRAMGERLPAQLLTARKRGFNVPMREWFLGHGPRQRLQACSAAGALQDVIDPSGLEQLIAEHTAQRVDHGGQLWVLLQLAHWCENHGAVSA